MAGCSLPSSKFVYNTLYTAISLASAVVTALAIEDASKCWGIDARSCAPPNTIRLKPFRTAVASLVFLHAGFFCFGVWVWQHSTIRLFFLAGFLVDVGLGVSLYNQGVGFSGVTQSFGDIVLVQPWFYNTAAVLAVFIDGQLAVQIRSRRVLPAAAVSGALSILVLYVVFADSVAAEAFVGYTTALLQVSMAAILFLEVLRGPLDVCLDPYVSCGGNGEQRDRVQRTRALPPGDTPSPEGRLSIPARTTESRGPKKVLGGPIPRQGRILLRMVRRVEAEAASGQLPAKAPPVAGPPGDKSGSGPTGRSRAPIEESEEPWRHRIRRLDELMAAEMVLLLVLASSTLYPISFYGGRFFRFSADLEEGLRLVADCFVVFLRFALSIAVIRNDALDVAKEAEQAQQWKRDAADARLGAIQQFTRYIFHEARVPLQAVSLAVEELESLTRDMQARARAVRRLQGAVGGADPQHPTTIQRTLSPGDSLSDGNSKGKRWASPRGYDAGAASEETGSSGQAPAQRLVGALSEVRDVLRSQQEGCKGLQLIFDDVLEAQRIEQGRLRLRDEVIRLRPALRQSVSAFEGTARKLGVRLKSCVLAGTPAAVRGDPVRLKQVLANLVSNALKYTPKGGLVSLSLGPIGVPAAVGEDSRRESLGPGAVGDAGRSIHEAAGHEEVLLPSVGQGASLQTQVARGSMVNPAFTDGDYQLGVGSIARLQIQVVDTGRGMTAETIRQLYTPYKQAGHGMGHTGSSSGLGLYISRGIARQMGGDLTASSEGEGRGSTFTFEFEGAVAGDRSDTADSTGSMILSSMAENAVTGVGQETNVEELGGGGETVPSKGVVSSGRGNADRNEREALGLRPAAVGGSALGGASSATARGKQSNAMTREDDKSAGLTGELVSRRGLSHESGAATPAAAMSGKGASRSVLPPGSPEDGMEAAVQSSDTGGSLQAGAAVRSLEALRAWCLVVDDVPTNRKLLARGLKRIGYQVALAADGQQALEACRQRAATASGASSVLGMLLMDKSMPVMDGIEATRAIRSEFGSSFVIVGLTGDAVGPEMDEFMQAGLNGVLGKPASAKDVDAKARSLTTSGFKEI